MPNNLDIFEFGAGYSTLFYSPYAKTVTSIETRQKWIDHISLLAVQNNYTNINLIKVLPKDFHLYLDSPYNNKKYDFIAVDSVNRLECVKSSISSLAPEGAILLDNCDRPNYNNIFTYMKALGFYYIIASGLGPNRDKPASTAIFYKENNIFNLKPIHAPIQPNNFS